ncbi:polysaccharide pyruvyl transferase family protein [Brevibacterium spongiae]|uniref:Polysaccharide pyruvyl transferase family protein n=1 Tax=Brevibacterium spongiae TaxID=2909672 RepID=A0ABY5SL16_9MICO|nr:polysaccharide pyruvyl transferase family protein [Brevibacterium spongiae]UVI35203.1 polysaccharide pyruvyl transferase family protein [Brevibacterium spongiae]
MKRITMIGDVGWSRFYHLGDEAMTELAIDALRDRTEVEITLIAGDPQHAAEMYGVDTIARIGFKREREPNLARMERVLAFAESDGARGGLRPNDPARTVIEAIRDSDAVLIAGGGNLNSMFAHHIYERVTLGRLAKLFGKPYALTSQTLGPLIYDEDRKLVYEFLADAEFLGSRESYTTRFAKEVGGKRAVIRRQVDDAFSLEARDEDRHAVADLVKEPFIVASFAEKASSPVLSDADYHAHLVDITRQLSEETGLTLLLVPHGGGLPPAAPTRDQLTNDQIVAEVSRSNVISTRMLTARELVALTEEAEFVIGTRYHAGIFAGAAGVPFISLVPNLYSSIRMRGAAENVGMEQFVLPVESVDDIVRTGVGVSQSRDEFRAALKDSSARRRAEHAEWWDFVVAHTIGVDSGEKPSASSVPAPGFFHADELANRFDSAPSANRARLSAIEEYGLLLAKRDRQLAVARQKAKEVTQALEVSNARHERQDSMLSVRAARRVRGWQRKFKRGVRRGAKAAVRHIGELSSKSVRKTKWSQAPAGAIE